MHKSAKTKTHHVSVQHFRDTVIRDTASRIGRTIPTWSPTSGHPTAPVWEEVRGHLTSPTNPSELREVNIMAPWALHGGGGRSLCRVTAAQRGYRQVLIQRLPPKPAQPIRPHSSERSVLGFTFHGVEDISEEQRLACPCTPQTCCGWFYFTASLQSSTDNSAGGGARQTLLSPC